MSVSSESALHAWATKLFATIDSMDAEGFAAFFAEDGVFTFGSFPTATGRPAIADFVGYFFSTLKSLHHTLVKIDEADELLYVHFKVTYEIADGRTVTIPGLETLEMDGELVKEYIIYMDPSPLQALQSEGEGQQ